MAKSRTPVQEGAQAPAFKTLDHAGTPFASQELDGRAYVLFFYPKADTPG